MYTNKSVSNKLLAEIGKIIDEAHKQPKTVRAYLKAKRGVGFTKKAAHQSKARRQMAKKSRKINRGK